MTFDIYKGLFSVLQPKDSFHSSMQFIAINVIVATLEYGLEENQGDIVRGILGGAGDSEFSSLLKEELCATFKSRIQKPNFIPVVVDEADDEEWVSPNNLTRLGYFLSHDET